MHSCFKYFAMFYSYSQFFNYRMISGFVNGDEFCTLESCSDSLSYLKLLEWDTNEGHADIFYWLKSQLKKAVVTFCKATKSPGSTAVAKIDPQRLGKMVNYAKYENLTFYDLVSCHLVYKEANCVNSKTNAIFKGKVDKDGLPDKQGVLERAPDSHKFSNGPCVRIAPGNLTHLFFSWPF